MKRNARSEESTNEPRVFISYTSKNLDAVLNIEKALRANGLNPMWARDLSPGIGFTEQIKQRIAHAHVILPVITKEAARQGWVHQEIGYAVALQVPVLPVSLGEALPDEMIKEYQAIRLTENPTMSELRSKLVRTKFDKLVLRARRAETPLYENAPFAEDRARLFVSYTAVVVEFGYTGRVRQKGALSSFHIPVSDINDDEWLQRMGSFNRSPAHRQLQLNERLALGHHAKGSGCRLIINPFIMYEKYGPEARVVRINTLVKFLRSKNGRRAQVVINPKMHNETSVTLVGDWFAAESASATIAEGYRQTIFTRHAPSVQRKIDDFDREFDGLLRNQELTAATSREKAIQILEDEIEKARKEIRDSQ